MIISDATFKNRFAVPRWTQDSPQWQALDGQLAPDHKARLIDQFVTRLDLSELEAAYRGSGSEAHRPDLILKIALYETLEGHLRPAAWHRHLVDHIPLLWLAMGIRPSRTAFYDFRDRLGHVVEALLTDVVATGQSEGFVKGKQAVLDGTVIRAQASRHRLLNQPRLQKRLGALNDAVEHDRAGQPVPERPDWMAATAHGRYQQRQRYLEAQAILERRSAENAQKPKDRRLAPEKVMVSVSDPEAPMGRDKEKVFGPVYTTQFLIEPCSLLIVSFDVFAIATDAGTLPPLLDQSRRILGRALDTVITDAGYVSILDLRACAERGVELIAPVHENDYTVAKKADTKAKKTKKAKTKKAKTKKAKTKKAKTKTTAASAAPTEPALGKDQFTWRPEAQTYRCPQGHDLKYRRQGRKPRRQGESLVLHEYQCPAEHCRECPLRQRCVKDPNKGRIVTRAEGEELLEAHRLKMATPEAKALKKLRGQVIERGFGDAKEHRNLRRLHGRGLNRAKAEIGLVVLAQNALMLHRLRQKAANTEEVAA
jgi:transposase